MQTTADTAPQRRRQRRAAALPDPRAMTTAAAAAYLGVSKALLRKYRVRGVDDPMERGPAYIPVGKNLVLYDRAELDRWLDAKAKKHGRAA